VNPSSLGIRYIPATGGDLFSFFSFSSWGRSLVEREREESSRITWEFCAKGREPLQSMGTAGEAGIILFFFLFPQGFVGQNTVRFP